MKALRTRTAKGVKVSVGEYDTAEAANRRAAIALSSTRITNVWIEPNARRTRFWVNYCEISASKVPS